MQIPGKQLGVRWALVAGLQFVFLLSLTVANISSDAQQTVANPGWSGQAQCSLTVPGNGYTHQETQTWVMTGEPPSPVGGMSVYPGKWSVTSQGNTQRPLPTQTLSAQWQGNVPGISAPINVFVRASDNRLVIGAWHAQLRAPGALVGTRQYSTPGTQSKPSPLVQDVYEWQFPKIEAAPGSTDVSGSGTIIVGGNYIPTQPASSQATANCIWHFQRGNSTPAVTNTPAMIKTPAVLANPSAISNSSLSKLAAKPSNSSGSTPPSQPPSLTSVAPASGSAGQQNVTVTLNGLNSHFAQGASTLSFGPGVSVVSLSVSSPTSATAVLNIDPSAAAGARTATLTTGNEAVSSSYTIFAAGTPGPMQTPSATRGTDLIALQWTSPANSGPAIDSYNLEITHEDGTIENKTVAAPSNGTNLPAPAGNYIGVNTFSGWRTYAFRICAHNSAGCGPYSPSTGPIRPRVSYNADGIVNIWSTTNCIGCHVSNGNSRLKLDGTASQSFNSIQANSPPAIASPAVNSELLTCPTGSSSCAPSGYPNHPGGVGFSNTNVEYLLILQWINDGHPF